VSEEPTPTPEATTPAPEATAEAPETPAAAPAPQPKKESGAPSGPYVWGTGRRKSSVARIRIKPGDGKFVINKKELDQYFCLDVHRAKARQPLMVTDTTKSYDVFANVAGGGTTGQADAVSLGLARALVAADKQHDRTLREHNLLSRDPRKVERKKYGQRGARRRFQFSKR
jgi:small subunit ribosomal protein S9